MGAHGFILNPDGKVIALEVPGASTTDPLGLNNRGQVVGVFRMNGIGHGFVMEGDVVTFLDVPDATDTSWVSGVNDHGQIVGSFNGFSEGFIATQPPGGK